MIDYGFVVGTNEEDSASKDFADEPEKEYIDSYEEFDQYCNDVAAVPKPEPSSQIETESPGNANAVALVKWICLFLFHLQAAHRISNVALNSLFYFLGALFKVLASLFTQLQDLAKLFPRTLHVARKYFVGATSFTRYSVCRKCHSIYILCDTSGERLTEKCTYTPYPNHPQQRMRKKCGTIILKSVEQAGGRVIYYPYLVYCYLGVEPTLTRLLRQVNFCALCEEWRGRVTDDCMHDIYDGAMWRDFQKICNKEFLSQPNTFGLALNIDWFQPYKHVKYSVGGIYCVILNLPRRFRYKQQNVLLIGLIPGPKEPELGMNSYLKPFVSELKEFWHGKEISVNGKASCYRTAILNVCCDLPAGRKVCGFLSYTAAYGCSKCLKKFSGSVGSMDYSGFDRDLWPLRNGDSHRQVASKMKILRTMTDYNKEASKTGVRYSLLLELPYFDAPRMLSVDPMHNLFLGTAKHMFNIWIEKDVFTFQQAKALQEDAC